MLFGLANVLQLSSHAAARLPQGRSIGGQPHSPCAMAQDAPLTPEKSPLALLEHEASSLLHFDPRLPQPRNSALAPSQMSFVKLSNALLPCPKSPPAQGPLLPMQQAERFLVLSPPLPGHPESPASRRVRQPSRKDNRSASVRCSSRERSSSKGPCVRHCFPASVEAIEAPSQQQQAARVGTPLLHCTHPALTPHRLMQHSPTKSQQAQCIVASGQDRMRCQMPPKIESAYHSAAHLATRQCSSTAQAAECAPGCRNPSRENIK
mmetsp:Transcript_51733/g.168124  ORF Transcript_51733/g.168124 Transcript_51733/m.168124 type:complete len:264 (+) Transcript_51733:696-1487(+)